VPFIFYTATYLEPREMELGLKLGASRYLKKPLEFSILFETLTEVSKEHRAGSPGSCENESPKPSPIDEEYQHALARKLEHKVRELEQVKDNLETQVKERTAELEEKVRELERLNRLFVDRELRMVELKDEIERLKNGEKRV